MSDREIVTGKVIPAVDFNTEAPVPMVGYNREGDSNDLPGGKYGPAPTKTVTRELGPNEKNPSDDEPDLAGAVGLDNPIPIDSVDPSANSDPSDKWSV